MKKSVKKLATILMLTAMVGFMGCTVSVGGDPVPQPTVPEQPSNPDEQTGGGGSTKPDSESGTQGEQSDDSKPDKTEDDKKPSVDPGKVEGESSGDNTSGEKDPSTNPDSESDTQGGQGSDPQNPGDDKDHPVDPGQGEGNKPNEGEKEPDTQITPAKPTHDSTREVNGRSYEIVTFGMWPQTVKADDVKILNENEPIIYNGWEAYKGNDDAYYVKRDTKLASNYKGTMQVGINYFKIEPIKWRVLTSNYNGKTLLFSETALDVIPYDANSAEGTTDYSNKYDTSDIRKFLNKDFFNKAFSKEEKAAILDTMVDNSQSSTIGKGQNEIENSDICENTTDKIFLLSLKEITTKEYGFNEFNKDDIELSSKKNNESRKIPASDYTIATGTYLEKVEPHNHCCYWLRSPVSPLEEENTVQMIGEDGRNGVSNPDGEFAIVPAFTIE